MQYTPCQSRWAIKLNIKSKITQGEKRNIPLKNRMSIEGELRIEITSRAE